jgi:RNA polymerase sigma-70 factor (ECF subfamily)
MVADALVLDGCGIVEQSRSGRQAPKRPMDEAKFEAFYRKTAGSLWSYIYRLTGDPAASDDLLQKAFFRFLRSNPTLAGDEQMRAYIFRTATNLAFDHFREIKRSRERKAWPVAAPALDRGDLRHDMMRIFGELEPRERALLWLAHVEESNHEEISEAMGVKPKSVRVLLFRARKKLAELLKRKGIGPEVVS